MHFRAAKIRSPFSVPWREKGVAFSLLLLRASYPGFELRRRGLPFSLPLQSGASCITLFPSYFIFAQTSSTGGGGGGGAGLTEAEKREKKVLEKKLTEMEEELKVGFFLQPPPAFPYILGKSGGGWR